jgi:hypothetical protein
MNYLVKAIQKLKPNAEFSITDNDYSTVKWDLLEGTAPTQKEIDAAIEQVKIEEAQAESTKIAARQALLSKLGITQEEAQLLLGGN